MIDREHVAQLRAAFGPMRMISFAATPEQCIARTKTETRRTGWGFARAGDHLLAVSRVMGFRKGERIDDVADLYGVIKLLDVYREPLGDISQTSVIAEGFPALDPAGFLAMFRKLHPHAMARDLVTVLRFAWVERKEWSP